MLCPKCTHSNPDENNFCGHCGAPLPSGGRITLKDVLDAGLLRGGEITIKLRGQDVKAKLLDSGKIEYQDKVYDGPLTGAIAVRGQVCDGWFCWNATDPATGRSYSFSHFRGALLRQRGQRS